MSQDWKLRGSREAATQGLRLFFFVLTLLGMAAIVSPCAFAADLTLATPGNAIYALRVTSYAELPFRTVIRQRYDYSCGSAALATLLRFHYGLNIDEAGVFKAMYAVGDQARIQKLGFSLLDMKKYLAAIGLQADGYRLSLGDLERANAPAIALVQIGSYKHFVVVKGVVGGHVLIGDPAQGLREFSTEDFGKIWNGIAFVVHDTPANVRPALFNTAVEWQHWADFHPLSAAILNVPLAPIMRDLRVIYQIQPIIVIADPFQP